MSDTQGLQVIGAGWPRTATMSLKLALTQLGFGPCYHMSEVARRPRHVAAWADAAKGKPLNFGEVFQEFRATMDMPAANYYKELMAAFPNAKVVLTERDSESWYNSVLKTNYAASRTSAAKAAWWLSPTYRRFHNMVDAVLWQGALQGRFADKDAAIKLYEEHIAEVKKSVPPHKLLCFHPREGWEPLCKFLGVPVPDTPFPRVNDAESFIKFSKSIRMKSIYAALFQGGAVLAAGLAVLFVLWR